MANLVTDKFIAEENVLFTNETPNQSLGARISRYGYENAVIEVKRLLGTTRYDEIVALGVSDASYKTLQAVLARLSFYYAFLRLNLRPTDAGGFVRSTGSVENQLDIMSARESRSYRGQIIKDARILVATLHTSTGLQPYGASPGGEIVYTL